MNRVIDAYKRCVRSKYQFNTMKTACNLVALAVIVLFVDVLTHPTVETLDISEESIVKDISKDEKDISGNTNFGVKIGPLKQTDETEGKKSYKGYQLWKLNVDSQNKSKVVVILKNNNGKMKLDVN